MIRPIHLVLVASLGANILTAAGYFYTRHALERVEATVSGSKLINELNLTAEQTAELRATRRKIRIDLRSLREEGLVLFDAALAQVRAAKPGDTSYEQALLATGQVRRKQTLVITRELISFREHLEPAQRDTFNRRLGEWAFIEALMGVSSSDNTWSPPSGPFQRTPAAPRRNSP